MEPNNIDRITSQITEAFPNHKWTFSHPDRTDNMNATCDLDNWFLLLIKVRPDRGLGHEADAEIRFPHSSIYQVCDREGDHIGGVSIEFAIHSVKAKLLSIGNKFRSAAIGPLIADVPTPTTIGLIDLLEGADMQMRSSPTTIDLRDLLEGAEMRSRIRFDNGQIQYPKLIETDPPTTIGPTDAESGYVEGVLTNFALVVDNELDRLGLADRYTTEVSTDNELYLILDLEQRLRIRSPGTFLLWLEDQTLTPDLSKGFDRPD